MAHARYVDALKQMSVTEAASRLGIEVSTRGGVTSAGSFQCPACGAETRHGERGQRARLSAGIRSDDAGWRCHDCKEGGDAINLICFAMFSRRDLRLLSDTDRKRLSDWVAHEKGTSFTPQTPTPPKRIAPTYPPSDMVLELWNQCVPVTQDAEISAWMRDKRIDTTVVVARNMARALPRDSGHYWVNEGRRLIVPMRDASGEIVNLKARVLRSGEDVVKSKSLRGFACAGLCFYDHNITRTKHVIFCEGEKKFMQLTSVYPHAKVFGIGSGMFPDKLATLLPADAEVWIAVDPNTAGAEYAAKLFTLLPTKLAAKAKLIKGLKKTMVGGKAKVTVESMDERE